MPLRWPARVPFQSSLRRQKRAGLSLAAGRIFLEFCLHWGSVGGGRQAGPEGSGCWEIA